MIRLHLATASPWRRKPHLAPLEAEAQGHRTSQDAWQLALAEPQGMALGPRTKELSGGQRLGGHSQQGSV